MSMEIILDKEQKIGFYAGSFDPFTNGHLHVVKKAAALFDKVIIGIGINPKKTRRFEVDIMLEAINKTLQEENLINVEVIKYEGLTAKVAKDNGCTYLIRGIRNGMDYEYEENIAAINEEISDLDTIYIRAGKLGIVSSSMVMELCSNSMDISKYVPNEIAKVVELSHIYHKIERKFGNE